MPPPPHPSRRGDAKGAPTKEENEYIPSFISKAPFYAVERTDEDAATSTALSTQHGPAAGSAGADYLEHQRLQNKQQDTAWYDRGKKGHAATKYRKGACENCGGMGHKKKDCLERPRKQGAKWTGKNIQADDVVQDVQLSWDAKRDRWNGFDAGEYKHVVEGYEQMEDLKKQMIAKRKAAEGGGEGDEETEENGDKYAEESDMSKHQPTSTRQLRLREDTAKYLLNLDLDSAKYDPKTRSMVDAGAIQDKAAELVAEEGFIKASGDASEFEQAQRYAWEAQEKSGDTTQHLQANPTAGEYYRRKEKEEAEKKRIDREKALKDKYGEGTQAMPAALKAMAVTENERFVEYDESGLIKGAQSSAKSKYPEDTLVNNHTSIWGSWWHDFQWGYECCRSFMKNSYCTGEIGRTEWEESQQRVAAPKLLTASEEEPEAPQELAAAETSKDAAEVKSSLKRTREEMTSGVTEEEMEEYRRKRTAANDPMAGFLGRDELVH